MKSAGKALGEFLRQARQLSGLTQEELAERAGLSVRAVGDLERGFTARPRRSSIQLLLDALQLPEPALAELARSFDRDLPPAVLDLLPEERIRPGFAFPGSAHSRTGRLSPDPEPPPRPQDWEQPPRSGPPPPRFPRPAQLPADIPDFTGRASALAQMRAILAAGSSGDGTLSSARILLVAGAGGLGKTTLAVHAAHLVAPQYPDGQLYVNLLGATYPRDPGDILERFLRDLGMDAAQIPDGEEDRSAAFRTRLAGKRILILLDDARDAAQVRPLLPGSASCAAVITSRSRMPDLVGARLLELGMLPAAEARTLFAMAVGEDRVAAAPEATGEVLTACAGLPLAIRVAGARLASRGGWSVQTLAARLADKRSRLDELRAGDLAVRASFEVSFSGLAGPAGPADVSPARAFRLLAVWTGPVSLAAAAALLGEPDSRKAAQALEVLVDAHLLDEPEPDRYSFHDLTRAYAAERAWSDEQEENRHAAIARLITWYLHTTEAAAQVIFPEHTRVPLEQPPDGVTPLTFTTVEEGLAWCEKERLNLATATQLAAERGLHELAWKLPAAAMSFFYRRSHFADWMTTHQTGLASARAIGDRRAQAWMLNNIGIAYGEQRKEEAMTCFEQAMALFQDVGDLSGERKAANNVANILLDLARYEQALTAAKQALEINHGVSIYQDGITLDILGCIHRELGRPREALPYLQQALDIFRQCGSRMQEADSLSDLGQAYLALGQFAHGTDCLRQSIGILREVGDRRTRVATLRHLSQAFQLAGDLDQAGERLAEALAVCREMGDEEYEAQIHADLAALAR